MHSLSELADLSSKSYFYNHERCIPLVSILGQLLFSFYENDLPSSVENAICDLFADDTSLHYASYNIDIEHNLNASINTVTDKCTANEMLVHPDKSGTMFIINYVQDKNEKGKLFLGIN